MAKRPAKKAPKKAAKKTAKKVAKRPVKKAAKKPARTKAAAPAKARRVEIAAAPVDDEGPTISQRRLQPSPKLGVVRAQRAQRGACARGTRGEPRGRLPLGVDQ